MAVHTKLWYFEHFRMLDIKISMRAPDRRDVILALFHAGDIFGELALVDADRRSIRVHNPRRLRGVV